MPNACRARLYVQSDLSSTGRGTSAPYAGIDRPPTAQMAHIIDVLSDFGAQSSSQILFFPHRDTEPRADMFTLQARTEEPFPLCARLSRRSYRFLSLYPEPELHIIPLRPGVVYKSYSARSATTGSFFAALEEGIIPENRVSAMLITIRITATHGGR